MHPHDTARIAQRHCHTLALSLTLAVAACRSTPAEPESARPAVQAEKPAEPPPAASAAPATALAGETPAATGAGSASADVGALGTGAAPKASASAAPGPVAKALVPIPPGHRKVVAKPVAPIVPSPGDPLAGKFTLEDAVKDLPGKGKLFADIKTDAGKLECELYEDRAPITVANFVGLARGIRPFKNTKGEWTKAPGYDGTTFHRIIKGFMIQGGDPQGTGAGEPGYVIPDEVWDDAYHSERGLLCMANRGPNTNGMQFFIMDGSSPHLDGGYTIFGKCGPAAVIEKLSSSEVRGDQAVKPPKIEKVTIRRAPPKK